MKTLKPTTEQILIILNDENIKNTLQIYVAQNPDLKYGDITMLEAASKYNFINDIIKSSISSSFFNDLPFNKRQNILENLRFLQSYIGDPYRTIEFIDQLQDSLLNAGLSRYNLDKSNHYNELKNIADLKAKLTSLISEIESKNDIIMSIDNKYSHIDEVTESVNTYAREIQVLLSRSKENSESLAEVLAATNSSRVVINKNESEIEAKRLSITTFSENIEEYKDSILSLESQAKAIIDKESTINDLINQAEKALNLKSAEGISAAFSSQYSNASKKWGLWYWLIGAGLFLIIAILLTVWIVSGYCITNPNSISSIIGRIVAVGISITGATFCAKQYTKQKNIAEDYAYKAVLSKSIIAFTDEIKKRDDDKVASYLEKVLSEIHKDPLRTRKDNSDIEGNNNILQTLAKMVVDFSKNSHASVRGTRTE